MSAAEMKSRLTMYDLLDRYGYRPDRRGFISCPFHSERTASLGIYDEGRRWKCFGCGAGGDIISFVQRLFVLSFAQAVTRLESDFGFAPPLPGTGPATARQRARRAAEQRQELEAYEAEWLARLYRYRMYEEEMDCQRPRPDETAMRRDYLVAARGADQEWEWLESHPWR